MSKVGSQSKNSSSPPRDPFGVLAFLHWNHAWNNFHFSDDILRKAIRQLKELGISFVRMDILWSDVHKDVNEYDFSRYDQIISLLKQNNIHILGLLNYNKIKDGPDGPLWNTPPESFEEFSRYVGATVNRYKDWIRYWEIWNEPNHPNYWVSPRDNLKPYSRLLRLSYDAAKSADPTCFVLNGGITDPLIEDVRHLYTHAKNYFDILSIHCFIDPLAPDRREKFDRTLNTIRKIMDENGEKEKPIWITEMGCPGVPSTEAPQKWFGGENVNEQYQAEWLGMQYELIKKHPTVEKLFWAFYRDTLDMFKDATDYFGLVRLDLSPKPAFFKMKELIDEYRQSTSS